ncbi:MAG: hypothetical protein ACI837_002183 [Crocinitomicaceae bacterium]|jgi:hypothetical protein
MTKNKLVITAFLRGILISFTGVVLINILMANGRSSRDDLAAYFLLIIYQGIFSAIHTFYFVLKGNKTIEKDARILILLIPLIIPLLILLLISSSSEISNSPGTSIILRATYVYLLTVIVNCWYTESQIKIFLAEKSKN